MEPRKSRQVNRLLMGLIAIVLFGIGVVLAPPAKIGAQQVGDQNLLKLRFINQGVTGGGANILQTGDLSTLSAAVATATLTQVVAAPASGQTYVRGVVVEKSTGAAGSFTLQYGTGTNCATGTTVLMGPMVNMPVQQYYLGFNIPAGQNLCAQTDAATTSVRIQFS